MSMLVLTVTIILTAYIWYQLPAYRARAYAKKLGLKRAAIAYSHDYGKLIDMVLPTRKSVFSKSEPTIWLYTDPQSGEEIFLTFNRKDVRIWLQPKTVLRGIHIVLDGSGNDRPLLSNLVSQKLPEQQVELEGDFPQHFKLYCGVNQQIIALQIIAPDIMAYCIDKMLSVDVEIVENQVAIIARRGARNKKRLMETIELALKLDKLAIAASKVTTL